MRHCSCCQRSDIAQEWEFCPRCGSHLTAAPVGEAAASGKGVKDLVIGMALDAAQNFVQSRFQQKLQPIGRLLAPAVAPGPSVSSGDWPQWYLAAVQEHQRNMDPSELARLQAQEITDAQYASRIGSQLSGLAQSILNISRRS